MASDWPCTFFTARLFLFSIYIYTDCTTSIFTVFNFAKVQCYYSVTDAFQLDKVFIVRHVVELYVNLDTMFFYVNPSL